ncbi:Homoaconitase, mitochondrial [Fusarium sp. AF-6]|nr:Homoaconitase, mitochondrial [Fusarium sp. AF-6]
MSGNSTKDRINHKRIDELLENTLVADPGAKYAKEYFLDLSTLSPFVAGPNSVKVANPVEKLISENIAIDKAYLLSCTNGRSTDFAAAARVFREAGDNGKPAKIHPRVKLYLAPASLAEQRMSEEAGDWQVLIQSGAELLPAGCATCIGLGQGLLEEGEPQGPVLPSQPRGSRGQCHPGSDCQSWLVLEPEGVDKVVVGEGAGDFAADKARSIQDAFGQIIGEMEGVITAAETEGPAEESASPPATEGETLTDVLPGFPEKVEGEIVFCDNDNINTDGIYPGRYTYQDGMTTEQMALVCMENYDTEFRNIIRPNDVLVAGYSFGSGSSREQAATSILANQIPLVVAGSFSNIFGRNSINNALLGIEIPKLVERLREVYGDDPAKPLTRRTGWKLVWDVRRSQVTITEQDGTSWVEKVGEMPPNVQEIIAKGGIVKWIQSTLQA